MNPWGFNFEDASFPLVVVTVFRAPTADEAKLLERLYHELHARERSYVMITDILADEPIDALARRPVVQLFRTFDEDEVRHCRASIVIVRSDFARAAVTAANLATKRRLLLRYVRDARAAAHQAEIELRALGVPLHHRAYERLAAMRELGVRTA